MRLLLSNDDGYTAPGLRCLADRLRSRFEIQVCAPDRNRSGASNSLTLLMPVRVQEDPENQGSWFVDGTPTDCVHLALTGLMVDDPPAMVVSGINAGPNLGDDTLYSGTVAAAMEGRHLGCAAIAISSCAALPQHYEAAAEVALRLVERLEHAPLPGDTILNVNVPDLPFEQLKGYEVTRLGNRHRAAPAVRSADPRGREIWWIGRIGPEQDCGPGTDFHAIANDRVSITPLTVDLTRHAAIDGLRQWMSDL